MTPTDRSRPATRIRVALVDDHRLLLDGLGLWIRQAADDLDVRVVASSWGELLRHPEYPVDVVLLDLDLGDGVPAAVKIAALKIAGVACVVVSAFGSPARVRECISAGAAGFVAKGEDASVIVRAVRAASRGGPYLTRAVAEAMLDDGSADAPQLSSQEHRALVLYVSGLPLKSVAQRLGVGYETAKSYLERVRAKYEACGRAARTKVELRMRAEEDGLVAAPGGNGPGDDVRVPHAPGGLEGRSTTR